MKNRLLSVIVSILFLSFIIVLYTSFGVFLSSCVTSQSPSGYSLFTLHIQDPTTQACFLTPYGTLFSPLGAMQDRNANSMRIVVTQSGLLSNRYYVHDYFNQNGIIQFNNNGYPSNISSTLNWDGIDLLYQLE